MEVKKMVTIEHGFDVNDVNNYKIVTKRIEREENNKKIVSKIEKVVYKNPKLVTYGEVYEITHEKAPRVLKNVKIFEIPNPYDLDLTYKRYNNLTWNLEQSILAVKEGYADGFYSNVNSMFGVLTMPFKVVDPAQATKVRDFFLNDLRDWIKKIKECPFSYAATITTNTSTYEIGKSKDPDDAITSKNIASTIKYLKEDNLNDDTITDYEARAKKLLERLYYKYNIINIWGERTADNLEFDTFKEAADFAKWLRRPNGAYDSEHVINSGVSLVNHGFQDWIAKQKAE